MGKKFSLKFAFETIWLQIKILVQLIVGYIKTKVSWWPWIKNQKHVFSFFFSISLTLTAIMSLGRDDVCVLGNETGNGPWVIFSLLFHLTLSAVINQTPFTFSLNGRGVLSVCRSGLLIYFLVLISRAACFHALGVFQLTFVMCWMGLIIILLIGLWNMERCRTWWKSV